MRLFKNLLTFLQLFSPSTFGIRMVQAAEAFETPPLSRAARRHAVAALCCLLAGAALLLTAALVDAFADLRPLSEKCGWAGIACLVVCVYSGLRYKVANRIAVEGMLVERAREKMDNHDRIGWPQ
jgi:hypothetical protein